jgi:hypothetical protein
MFLPADTIWSHYTSIEATSKHYYTMILNFGFNEILELLGKWQYAHQVKETHSNVLSSVYIQITLHI